VLIAAGLPGLIVGMLAATGWSNLGGHAEGQRLATMQQSSRYDLDTGQFNNQLSTHKTPISQLALDWIKGGTNTRPSTPPPIFDGTAAVLARPPASDLRITWLGHSSVLIEIDGSRVLTDPVWGPRASPWSFIGPERFHAPALALSDLPPLDAVVISHDHYDHLDAPTIRDLADRVPLFLVPLGVGAHLESWGVAAEKIVELDWWQAHDVGALQLIATPSRHFSGRRIVDTNATLWASWSLIGPEHRVYFSGDTAMSPDFKTIGDRLGPFDVALIESGAYNKAWADVHLGPEQALQAFQDVRGSLFMPIHWATFDLALHAWTEPVERILAEAARLQLSVAVPMPGQSIEPATLSPLTRWWPEIPWKTANEHPVVSSGLDRDHR